MADGKQPGQAAYEAWAWCIFHDSGRRGSWPAWADLEPEGRRAWARHERLPRLAKAEVPGWLDEPVMVRLPLLMHGWLAHEARRSERTLDEEIVQRLQSTAGGRGYHIGAEAPP